MSHKLFRLRASRRMPLLLFPSRPAIRVCSKAGIRGLAHRAKASGGMPDHSEGGYFVLPHLAAAALRAISWRCSLVMPGDWPPKRNHRLYLDVASTSGLEVTFWLGTGPVEAKPSKGFSPTPPLPTRAPPPVSVPVTPRSCKQRGTPISPSIVTASCPTELRRLCGLAEGMSGRSSRWVGLACTSTPAI